MSVHLARLIAVILCCVAAFAPPAAGANVVHFDLVLRGGRIMDGTGNGWFFGDVGIRGDRIGFVGTLKDGAYAADRELDARGLIVAPGFIDVHTHADSGLYRMPAAENFVRDGVTTIITGNCGSGLTNVGEYFTRLGEKGTGVNVATLIGHNAVLRAVKGNVAGELSAEQMAQAKQMVDDAMRDGAVGLSTGLIYTPGRWSSTEEIIELARVAAGHGGIYASHMRSEGTGILKAIDEALRIGHEANCRVQISHFKLPTDAGRAIGGTNVTLGKIADARAAGQEVWLDQYPYTASSTTINTLLPSWVLEHGLDEARKTLADPAQAERVVAEMRETFEVGRQRESLAYVVVASCRAYPHYAGRNLKEIAQLMKFRRERGEDVELLQPATAASTAAADVATSGASTQATTRVVEWPRVALPDVTMEDQYRAVIDIAKRGSASCVFHSMAEPDVSNILRHPLVAVASDSGVREFGVASPHPRGYGTNARVLGRYAREMGVISMEEAVRKMTSLPATAFRFHDRGLVRAGYVADLTVFDPRTVIDRATFDQPHQYSDGIPHVIVNGQLVLHANQMTGALPGRPVHGSGKRK